jgi:DNA-binding XRE family transcriptional regulator
MTRVHEWIPRSGALRIGHRLCERRRAWGLTQTEVAARAGVAQSTFVHWETRRLPDTIAVATASTLATALQAPRHPTVSDECSIERVFDRGACTSL